MKPPGLWSESVGFLPYKVAVYEHPDKAGTLYLRRRARGNWRKRSVGVPLRDERGQIRLDVQRMALAEAARQYEILSGRRASPARPLTPLTIGETWATVRARDGLYPILTPHAKEVGRALAAAARIWGAALPWNAVDRARIRMLGRTRIDELRAAGRVGYRSAELTVQRILSVAAWLRDEGTIASDACVAPRRWREDLRSYWSHVAGASVSEPARPRHSLEEMRGLLKAAPSVDPRFALLLALGAELRLGVHPAHVVVDAVDILDDVAKPTRRIRRWHETSRSKTQPRRPAQPLAAHAAEVGDAGPPRCASQAAQPILGSPGPLPHRQGVSDDRQDPTQS